MSQNRPFTLDEPIKKNFAYTGFNTIFLSVRVWKAIDKPKADDRISFDLVILKFRKQNFENQKHYWKKTDWPIIRYFVPSLSFVDRFNLWGVSYFTLLEITQPKMTYEHIFQKSITKVIKSLMYKWSQPQNTQKSKNCLLYIMLSHQIPQDLEYSHLVSYLLSIYLILFGTSN